MNIFRKFFPLTMILLVFALGCQDHCAKPAGKTVLVKINNYELTEADFQDEARLTAASAVYSPDPKKAKEELLNELVNKKILIQEAQKENFDKDRAFMKEIERYWEQALLKLLLEKKAEEFSRAITVDKSEVEKEYGRLKRKILAQAVVLDDKAAAEKLSAAQDKFNEVKAFLKGSIVSPGEAEWYVCADLPPDLEDVLFSLKPGEVSAVVKYNGNWAVLRALEEKEVQIGPLSRMDRQIAKNILEKKKQKAIEDWLAGLRRSANVKIDAQAVERVRLGED